MSGVFPRAVRGKRRLPKYGRGGGNTRDNVGEGLPTLRGGFGLARPSLPGVNAPDDDGAAHAAQGVGVDERGGGGGGGGGDARARARGDARGAPPTNPALSVEGGFLDQRDLIHQMMRQPRGRSARARQYYAQTAGGTLLDHMLQTPVRARPPDSARHSVRVQSGMRGRKPARSPLPSAAFSQGGGARVGSAVAVRQGSARVSSARHSNMHHEGTGRLRKTSYASAMARSKEQRDAGLNVGWGEGGRREPAAQKNPGRIGRLSMALGEVRRCALAIMAATTPALPWQPGTMASTDR